MRSRLPAFGYAEACSVDDALSFLSSRGARAKALAGGTDLLTAMRMKGARPSALVNLKTIPGLDKIEGRDDGLHIGALATMQAVAGSPGVAREYACLAQAASVVGSWQVRCRATLGGNLCNGAPSAEMAPPLLVLGAKAAIAEPGGRRQVIDLERFFHGPGATECSQGKLLLEVIVPKPEEGLLTIYMKHSPRKAMDIAVVGVAVALSLDRAGHIIKDARIALGAVASTPLRAREAEESLVGRAFTCDVARDAGRLAAACARPISDVRASAEYRLEMIEVMVARALTALVDARRGGQV